MKNRELVDLIIKAKKNDVKATFDIILELESLISKESMINGVFNQECKDYIIDNLLKQIKKFKEI